MILWGNLLVNLLLSCGAVGYGALWWRKNLGPLPRERAVLYAGTAAGAALVLCAVMAAVPGLGTLCLFRDLLLFWALFIAGAIDAECRRIPNGLVIFLGLAGLGVMIAETLRGDAGSRQWLDRLLGALTVFLLLALSAAVSRGGIGAGDIKWLTVLGFWVGISSLFSVLFLIFLPTALCSVFLLLFRRKTVRNGLPLAPFIWLGGTAFLVLSRGGL